MNAARNCWKTGSMATSTRQNVCAAPRSYEWCTVSRSNGIGSGISTGIVQMRTRTPMRSSSAITAA